MVAVSIDDIFMIWTHFVDDLHAFTSYLNSIHPTIKFTSNYSFTSIPFLDVNVFVDNGNITTDLYTKATDKHQYLLHFSCHPQHTKRAIPFRLALRLRHICSSDETFKQRSNELKSYLNKRGYNLSFLKVSARVKKGEFSKFLISRCSDKAFQELSFKKIPQKNILSVQSYWTLKFTTR